MFDLDKFIEDFINSQEDLPPEFQKVLNEHFWELLEEDNNNERDKI